jgi:hypothetical protein
MSETLPPMEYYLLRISYTASGWDHITHNTTSYDQRMEPVRKLIAHLGGSLACFHFYDKHEFKNDALRHSVCCKFAVFGGEDLMAVLCMQNKVSVQAFKIALLAQPGIKTLELVSMMPYADVVASSLQASKAARLATGYSGPGPAAPSGPGATAP